MSGDVKNNTGRVGHDITVTIKPKGPSCSVPNITHASVGGTTAFSGPAATTFTALLGGGSRPPAFQIGGQQSLDIRVGNKPTNSCSKYEICVTLSAKRGSDHYDIGADCALSASSSSATNTLGDHGNAGLVAWVKNMDPVDDGKSIDKLSGTVTFPQEETNSVTNVYLTDAEGDDVAATVTTDGNTFTVTNFAVLQPGSKYSIWIKFQSKPGGSTQTEITARFEE